MTRTEPLSREEITEMEAAVDAVERARDAVEDLRDKMKRRGDDERASALRGPAGKISDAARDVARAFA